MADLLADPSSEAPEGDGQDIDLSDIAPDSDASTEISVDDDGGVTITIGKAKPAIDPASLDHGDNLAEALDTTTLMSVAFDLLDAIERDDQSRSEWIETRAEGMRLLGLTLKKPDGGGSGGIEGMSTVDHPLLLEAVLRFQANARSELLPTDGPVKIRDDGLNQSDDGNATELERALNHYLTTTATEYYPDTDRMLWSVGAGGMAFKKVYPCPIRRRPVSEMVDAVDVIVSNDATDLSNASRVTHRIKMRASTLKRMQIVGAYRDVVLGDPGFGDMPNAVDQAVEEIDGLSMSSDRPEDRPRLLFECYCELDLAGFEHEEDGEPTGLPLPYKVTIDKESMEILEVRRNWDPDDEMKLPRQVLVPFPFVPGPGFYALGLINILGNTTLAVTAAWRIMLDAGMFANFPGGLIADTGMRQDSMSFRMGPGEFKKVKATGGDIRSMVMALPYKGPDQATMELVQDITQTAQRVGGTAEAAVGEGKQDAPVGTTLALIEQAGKVMDAVHKRLCAAQAVEFRLLVELFRADPAALLRGSKRPGFGEAELLVALDTYDLVPVADPNTSSHLQRINKMVALRQMAKDLGPLANLYFDIGAINKASVDMLQLPNGDRFLNPKAPPAGWMPPPPPGKGAPGQGAPQKPPDPVDQAARMMEAKAAAQDADTRRMAAQGKISADQARLSLDAHAHQAGLGTDPASMMDAQTRRMDAQTRAQGLVVDQRNNERDAQQQAADRQSENHIAAVETFKDLGIHADKMADSAAARDAAAEAAKLGS